MSGNGRFCTFNCKINLRIILGNGLITVELLLLIKLQFTADAQNALHTSDR